MLRKEILKIIPDCLYRRAMKDEMLLIPKLATLAWRADPLCPWHTLHASYNKGKTMAAHSRPQQGLHKLT